jgi:hypothetical protein
MSQMNRGTRGRLLLETRMYRAANHTTSIAGLDEPGSIALIITCLDRREAPRSRQQFKALNDEKSLDGGDNASALCIYGALISQQ